MVLTFTDFGSLAEQVESRLPSDRAIDQYQAAELVIDVLVESFSDRIEDAINIDQITERLRQFIMVKNYARDYFQRLFIEVYKKEVQECDFEEAFLTWIENVKRYMDLPLTQEGIRSGGSLVLSPEDLRGIVNPLLELDRFN